MPTDPPRDNWQEDGEGEDAFQQGGGDESQDFAEDGTGGEGYFDEHGNFDELLPTAS
jgi:hypothetical protein